MNTLTKILKMKQLTGHNLSDDDLRVLEAVERYTHYEDSDLYESLRYEFLCTVAEVNLEKAGLIEEGRVNERMIDALYTTCKKESDHE